MTNILTERRLGQRAAKRTKAAIFGALAKAGVTQVCVRFEGENGHGQMESAVAKTHDGCVPFPEITITVCSPLYDRGETKTCEMMLQDAVEHLCWDWLEWEVDDDSFGEFAFEVEKQQVTLDLHKRSLRTEHAILEL